MPRKLLNVAIPFLLAAVMMTPVAAEKKIFPFQYHVDDLDNGLRLVTVPLTYPNMVATWIVVRTGSRNEIEPGKSGFAHFFEHMMFRGTKRFNSEQYDGFMKSIGAETNAYTTDDYTAYHTLFVKEDLEAVMDIESDRFQHLDFPETSFRTEAKAVLGEYNKNSANPIQKLIESLHEKAFDKHTYKHTTMGFIEDIKAMPDQFQYGLKFFDRFYRPENAVLVVVGDVKHDATLKLAKKYFGPWKRGSFKQEIPVEPAQTETRHVSVDWPTPTLPWVVVAHKGPAYSDTQKDMPAMDLISAIAFSQSSPLYQKLVIKEQKVDAFGGFFGNQRDPGLLLTFARVKDAKDMEYVQTEILKTLEDVKSTPVSAERLEAVKSNLKYSFALQMDNTESVAQILASYLELNPHPETINRLYNTYDSITPEDIMRLAKKYFSPERRTLAGLAHKPGDAGEGQ
jgi:zinc protease